MGLPSPVLLLCCIRVDLSLNLRLGAGSEFPGLEGRGLAAQQRRRTAPAGKMQVSQVQGVSPAGRAQSALGSWGRRSSHHRLSVPDRGASRAALRP